MSILKSMLAMLAVVLLGVGCTTTSSQTKTSTVSSVDTSKQVENSGKAERLDDIYDRSAVRITNDETLEHVDTGAIPSDKKIVIKLKPNFGREFLLCEKDGSCKPVMPVVKQNQMDGTNSGNGYSDPQIDTNFVADVSLSDKTNSLLGAKIPALSTGKRILIMEPDVELNLLTAGGLQEPNALWSSAAKGYVTEIATQYFQKLGHGVSLYEDEANEVSEKTGRDLINLHEAVGQSIFVYQYQGLFQLPTKKSGDFNWKLGKTAKQLKEGYGTDLGLFIYLRDSYSSGSRVAAQFLMAALFGAHIPGGQQVGFVSLVDLENGDIVWFNRLHSTTGDLRTFNAALNATDALLKDIPL